MKRLGTLRTILTIALFAGFALCIHAEKKHGARIVSGYVNLNDSANVYRALYENTPIEPEFKLVPKFAIVGADNKFVFSVGASMKFTASFDWNNPVRNPMGMGPSDLTPTSAGDNHLYQMSAGGSGIFFNIIGFPNTANEIGLFISVGVDNESNNTYKLSAGQVYMRYRDFQCGYATSLYNDRKADAYVIDAHGPCSSGGYSTVGMNWQRYVNKYIRIGVGVEIPKASYTQIIPKSMTPAEGVAAYAVTSHQNMPNFPLYVGYDWGNGHLRLSGIIRNVHYVDLYSGKDHNVIGGGLKLTGNATVGPVNLFWMGQLGRGNANSFKDNADSGLDLVPDNDNPGILKPTRSWGCIVGAQWNISKKVFTTLQYSYLRNYIPKYDLDATIAYPNQMRHCYTNIANVVWKISSLFSTGIEYRHAYRHNESGISISNNRIYAMLMMTF